MSYTIEYKPSSLEDIKQLNRQIQSRIIKKITWLAEKFENITPLALSANLSGAYKFRVNAFKFFIIESLYKPIKNLSCKKFESLDSKGLWSINYVILLESLSNLK